MSILDCDDKWCTCSICQSNQENGGACNHCINCVNGYKATESNKLECFVKK